MESIATLTLLPNIPVGPPLLINRIRILMTPGRYGVSVLPFGVVFEEYTCVLDTSNEGWHH